MGGEDGAGIFSRCSILLRASLSSLDDGVFAGGRESNWVRCPERRLRDGSRTRVMGAATDNWRRGREAWRGAVDIALARSLDLDGESVGDVFRRGGGLHRRRLPNGVTFGGDGTGRTQGWATGATLHPMTGCGLSEDALSSRIGKMAIGLM